MTAIGFQSITLEDTLVEMRYQGEIKIKNKTSEEVQSTICLQSQTSERLASFKIVDLRSMEKKTVSIDNVFYLKNVKIEENKATLSIVFKNDPKKNRLVFSIIKIDSV